MPTFQEQIVRIFTLILSTEVILPALIVGASLTVHYFLAHGGNQNEDRHRNG